MTNPDELVAEIKTLYARRHADKLQIQKNMAALRDEHDLSLREIETATGIPKSTVENWLAAYDEGLSNLGQAGRLTPQAVQDASDRRVAVRVIKESSPDDLMKILANDPEARNKVAVAAAAATPRRPEHQTTAEKKAFDAEHGQGLDDVTRAFAQAGFLGPLSFIEQATASVKSLIEAGATIDELPQTIMAYRELGEELWVYGAQNDLDVREIRAAIDRWSEEGDTE